MVDLDYWEGLNAFVLTVFFAIPRNYLLPYDGPHEVQINVDLAKALFLFFS